MKHFNLLFTFLIIFFYFIACKSSDNKGTSKNLLNEFGNIDSLKRVDSMKWYYYMATYNSDAYFYDSIKDKMIKLNPLECDVVLEDVIEYGKDSSKYIFSFTYENMYFKTTKPLSCVGIRNYDRIISPIFNHITFDYENNRDSARSYMSNHDSTFRVYLRNYHGRFADWLKQEAIKRNVIL